MATNEPQNRPSDEDATHRLVVLKYVIVYALTAPPRGMLDTLFQQWSADDRISFEAESESRRNEFWQPLRESALWKCIAPSERELAQTTIMTMSPQQQIDATWRVEAAQVLMWALGLVPDLPPYDTRADHDLLNQVHTGDIPRFVSSARLRSEGEIDRARDDAELWHWRSRTRQLIEDGAEIPANEQTKSAGFDSFDDMVRFTARKLFEEGRIWASIDEDFPARGEAYRKLSADEWSEVRSITMERHFALNWLCGYAPDNEWDETPTDT
jgi:hypothetical protein